MSLAVRRVATYQEITSYWDIDEVFAMQEILDRMDDLEADEMAKLKARTEARR